MQRYQNTFEYITNDIKFRSVLNPDLSKIPSYMQDYDIKNWSHIAGDYTSANQYLIDDDIEFNKEWDTFSFINCIDIDWNDAELYGTETDEIYIASTTDLLNYVTKISNTVYNTSYNNEEIDYNNVREGNARVGNIYACNNYASQSDIEENIRWDMQYFVNCSNIDWDGANLKNGIVLNTSSDFLTLINNLIGKMLLPEKQEL